MRDDDEDRPRRPAQFALGAPLDGLSVDELGDRIAALQAEIARLEAAREKKRAANAAADAFFRK